MERWEGNEALRLPASEVGVKGSFLARGHSKNSICNNILLQSLVQRYDGDP